MAKYMVSYDLKAPGKDYTSLYSALRTYTNAKINKSDWLIQTTKPIMEVWNHLYQHIDSNDALFICSVTSEAVWENALASEDDIKRILNS